VYFAADSTDRSTSYIGRVDLSAGNSVTLVTLDPGVDVKTVEFFP